MISVIAHVLLISSFNLSSILSNELLPHPQMDNAGKIADLFPAFGFLLVIFLDFGSEKGMTSPFQQSRFYEQHLWINHLLNASNVTYGDNFSSQTLYTIKHLLKHSSSFGNN